MLHIIVLDFICLVQESRGLALYKLQPRPLRPLPRDLQHPDPAGAGDPPGDGAQVTQ